MIGWCRLGIEFVGGWWDGSHMESITVIGIQQNSDITPWVNILVTSLAAFAALYAGLQARSLLAIEVRRESDRILKTKQEQARLVAAWPNPAHTDGFGPTNLCKPGIEVIVQNNSLQPIFEVLVEWWISEDLEHTSRIDQVPPQRVTSREIGAGLIDKYTGIEGYEISFMSPEQAEEDCMTICEITRISIKFRDSQNQWWIRDVNGILKALEK